jgi:hypothetical protein
MMIQMETEFLTFDVDDDGDDVLTQERKLQLLMYINPFNDIL